MSGRRAARAATAAAAPLSSPQTGRGVPAAPAVPTSLSARATGSAPTPEPRRAAHPATASVAVQRPGRAAIAESPAPAPTATAAPTLSSAPPKVAAAVLAGITLGGDPGRLPPEGPLADGPTPPSTLAHPRDVLPELAEPPVPKKLTRQPAFIVSMSIAAAALVAVGVIVLLNTVFAPPAQVEKLSIEDVGGSYHITWDGPNVPYAAVRTTDSTEPADISAQIRGGRELWLPKTGGIVPADSCFVVVELAQLDGLDLTGSDDDLARAGAQRACVRDAVQGAGG